MVRQFFVVVGLQQRVGSRERRGIFRKSTAKIKVHDESPVEGDG